MEVIVSESKTFSKLYPFGDQYASEWGTGLQEKSRRISVVQESQKEHIYFKGIRP